MRFCPDCGNLLLVEHHSSDGFLGSLRFCCQTCSYVSTVTDKISRKIPLDRKQVDDVLGGADAWDNVDQTATKCPLCSNGKAYFMQIQIRSADEPMTIFYKCTACGERWREN